MVAAPSTRSPWLRAPAALAGVVLLMTTITGAPPAEAKKKPGPVQRILDRMTLEEKIGQLFVLHAYGTSATTTDPEMVAANQALYGVDNFQQVIQKYKPSGAIYFAFSNNVDSPRQIARLSNALQATAAQTGARVPLHVAIDQEQGLVVRVDEPFTQFPGSMALGATRKPKYARRAAAITARELLPMGINQNYAPVADVNVNPLNPVIGIRSFGSRPGLVSRMVRAQVRGFQNNGVSSTAKHFPGHGDTDTDSHTGLPVIDRTLAELQAVDLPPFQTAIDAGVDAIMTAHIVLPALDDSGRPATLSKPILTGLLRTQMGFKGLIVTDALTMEGVRQMFGDDRVPVEAIKAGADVMLMPPEPDAAFEGIKEAIASGEISMGRINTSVRRIVRLKRKMGLLDDTNQVKLAAVNKKVGPPEHLAEADRITRETVTLLRNSAGVLPLEANTGQTALLTGWGPRTLATLSVNFMARGVSNEMAETGLTPGPGVIAQTVAKAAGHDLVVVSTNRAWTNEAQQDLVHALVATGKPVIVLASRDAYDIAHLDDVETFLTAYGFRTPSLNAVTRVLFGELDPVGKLPISIPSAGDPSQTLFPFGYSQGF